MIYLSSFMLSNKQVKNPNIYPYNVFRGKNIEPFVFSPITVFYGNNGSGKSTLLNIIANKLQLKGKPLNYKKSNSTVNQRSNSYHFPAFEFNDIYYIQQHTFQKQIIGLTAISG